MGRSVPREKRGRHRHPPQKYAQGRPGRRSLPAREEEIAEWPTCGAQPQPRGRRAKPGRGIGRGRGGRGRRRRRRRNRRRDRKLIGGNSTARTVNSADDPENKIESEGGKQIRKMIQKRGIRSYLPNALRKTRRLIHRGRETANAREGTGTSTMPDRTEPSAAPPPVHPPGVSSSRCSSSPSRRRPAPCDSSDY